MPMPIFAAIADADAMRRLRVTLFYAMPQRRYYDDVAMFIRHDAALLPPADVYAAYDMLL